MASESTDEVIKKGQFKRMTFTSSKKFFCNNGKLTLTEKGLFIDCEGNLPRFLPSSRFTFEVSDENPELEVYEPWYHRLRFRFQVDEPEEWKREIGARMLKRMKEGMNKFSQSIEEEMRLGKSREDIDLRKLFSFDPNVLKALYNDVQKEMTEYRAKNIRFNLEIRNKLETIRDQKVKAFMIAHVYLAWYEWLKSLLYKIHKAKFGKGPKDDNELMAFLTDYPALKNSMNQSEWGMTPNQMRNCVAHEKFYFDFKTGELVFMVGKEKRVRLLVLRFEIRQMIFFYFRLLGYLGEVQKRYSRTKGTKQIIE